MTAMPPIRTVAFMCARCAMDRVGGMARVVTMSELRTLTLRNQVHAAFGA